MNHQPETPEFEAMVRESFSRMGMMAHLGAKISIVRPGAVEVRLSHRDELLQQSGLFHGGVTTTILDSAGGYAAFSLFKSDDEILTVEYKVNFIAPAIGDELVARGEVIKIGKILSITRGEACVIKDGKETPCAIMQQTMMQIVGPSNGTNHSPHSS